MNDRIDSEKVEKWGQAVTGSRISQDAVDYISQAARKMVGDELSVLIESGATPNQALDIWATEVAGIGVGTWADVRGADPKSVAVNVEKGRRRIVTKDVKDS